MSEFFAVENPKASEYYGAGAQHCCGADRPYSHIQGQPRGSPFPI